MTYQSSYEVDLDIGFALLEQVEGQQGAVHFESDPEEDELTNIMMTGLHGGNVDPDRPQRFYVYDVDWPDQLHDVYDEDVAEGLAEELNSLFEGWVVDRDEDQIYALRDPNSPEFSDVR